MAKTTGAAICTAIKAVISVVSKSVAVTEALLMPQATKPTSPAASFPSATSSSVKCFNILKQRCFLDHHGHLKWPREEDFTRLT